MKMGILLLLLGLTLSADHVRWQGDFEKARVEALKEKKEIMVLLIKSNCSPCMKMLRTTFIDQAYIAYINQHYISVLVNKDQKQSYPIELLYTLEYPTIFFLDTQEVYTKDALVGYVTPDTLEQYLKD